MSVVPAWDIVKADDECNQWKCCMGCRHSVREVDIGRHMHGSEVMM